MRSTATKRKLKKWRWHFRGIGKDAAILGVERSHLYRVLTGKRLSPRLLIRYRALRRNHNQTLASIRKLADVITSPPPKSKTV
jgi:hypothetical protein